MKDFPIPHQKYTHPRQLLPHPQPLPHRLLAHIIIRQWLHTLIRRDIKVVVKPRLERRESRHFPAHPPLERRDLLRRHPRHKHQRRVARVQVREMPDVVGDDGAAGAAGVARQVKHVVADD